MSVVDSGPNPTGIINRVMALITQPRAEWERISTEPATVQSLFLGYGVILAAIPALAALIGNLIFVHIIPLALISAIVTYVMSLASVFVFGIILEMLAPSFDAQKDRVQAMKVAVYGSTGTWVGGILGIIPFIGWVGAIVGGLFTLYLIFVGNPIVMRPPAEKASTYTIVALVVSFVVNLIMGMIAGAALGAAALTR